MLIICDIDGTIACFKDRFEKAGEAPDRKKYPKKFQAWLDKAQPVGSLLKDRVIFEVAETVKSLCAAGASLVYLTGRSSKYREETERWLFQNGLPSGKVYMREDEYEDMDTCDYKRDVLKQVMNENQNLVKSGVLAIDDDYDGDCAKVYSELGIKHLKVME